MDVEPHHPLEIYGDQHIHSPARFRVTYRDRLIRNEMGLQ